MMYVDCHTHCASSVVDVLTINSLHQHDSWEQVGQYPNRLYSVGYHPWYLDAGIDVNLMKMNLLSICAHSNVVAVGECGIDKLRGPSIDQQTTALLMQIEVSELVGKPLIVHCVKSFNEILFLRKNNRVQQPWVFHGFAGSNQLARQAINAGCYLSVGFRHLQSFDRLVAGMPIDRLLFESDDAVTSVVDLCEKAAACLNVSVEFIKASVWENCCKVFNIN